MDYEKRWKSLQRISHNSFSKIAKIYPIIGNL